MSDNTMSKKVQYDLTLFNDDSVREKLTVLDKMETMFDDERNIVPDSYYELIENLSLGSTIRVTVEVISNEEGSIEEY